MPPLPSSVRSPASVEPADLPASVDVLVIGAGTAGAAVARACARAGLSVACVDKRPIGGAGARWINGVPAWCYEAGDLELPDWPEKRGEGGTFHLVAGWGPTRLSFSAEGLLEIDMRALVARLQRDARRAGAVLVGEAPVLAWSVAPSGGGTTGSGAVVETAKGRVHARWVVDAAGLGGTRRLARTLEPVPRTELCVAAQQVRDIVDIDGARAFLDHHGVGEHQALVFTGIAGGYSIVNVRVALEGPEGPEVGLLTGSIPGLGHRAGPVLLEDFVREHAWIGARRFGGSGSIPLVPPLPSLVDGPIVRLGDAGRQVFAAHGSGIGAQLVAAQELAQILSAGGSAWDWNVAWQRRWGGLFCSSVVFARFSRSMEPDRLEPLLRSGLLGVGLAEKGLAQRPMKPDLGDLLGILAAAPRAPGLLAAMAPVVARMQRLELHHRFYPDRPEGLPRWTRHRNRLTGD